jgi:hypothetical protein
MAQLASDHAVPEFTRGCWIDLFDAPRYSGKLRRIWGPAIYLKLRSADSEIADPQTTVRFVSLIVGPTAYVHLFAQRRPERGGSWLLPRQKLADLMAIKSDLELDSIRILNRPPFPHEPGYSAFVRHVGRQNPEKSGRKRRRGRR